MRKLRTLIVDDEPIARNVLREELEQFDQVELVGEADSGLRALEVISSTLPDLVFLDLQMPGLTGFEVIERIDGSTRIPIIIVVTAYNEFAMQAFESGAIDYLLKPVRQERLALALEKAAKINVHPEGPAQQVAALLQISDSTRKPVHRIVAKSGVEYFLLRPEEVLAFEADGDVVWIITARKKLLATETLRFLQDKLQGTSFKRIHRKALVNLDHIRKMSPLTSQRWLITLSNNLEYIVSKRQAKGVRDLLS